MSTTPEDRIRAEWKAWVKRGDEPIFQNEEPGVKRLEMARKWKKPCWEIRAIVERTGMYARKKDK